MKMPIGFVGHGAPTIVVEPQKGAQLQAWGQALPRPTAVLVVSAHWEAPAPITGTVDTRPLMYDFGGFPQALYEIQYPAPGAPDVADRVVALTGATRQPTRPLDHGVWTPLYWMFAGADVPVLQVALPRQSPAQLFDLGTKLAPLRSEGVFILGSGNITHNLRRIGGDEIPGWASAFDAWCEQVLATRNWDALLDYDNTAPDVAMNHPTREHFTPLLVAAGAAMDDSDVTFPVTGWEWGSLSRRCVQFG